MNAEDTYATQIFSIKSILTNFCGQKLTPDTLDKIVEQIENEIRCGKTAWAFKHGKMAP